MLRFITTNVTGRRGMVLRHEMHGLGHFMRLQAICETRFARNPALLRWGFAVLLRYGSRAAATMLH